MNWILIIILIALVIFLSTKFKEFGAKSKFSLLVFVLAIFLITVGYVWFATRPNLATYSGFLQLGKSYYSWLGGLFGNMGHITGYAVKQDWGVSNVTSALP